MGFDGVCEKVKAGAKRLLLLSFRNYTNPSLYGIQIPPPLLRHSKRKRPEQLWETRGLCGNMKLLLKIGGGLDHSILYQGEAVTSQLRTEHVKGDSHGRSPLQRESLVAKGTRLKKGNVSKLIEHQQFEWSLESMQGGFCRFQHLNDGFNLVHESCVGSSHGFFVQLAT